MSWSGETFKGKVSRNQLFINLLAVTAAVVEWVRHLKSNGVSLRRFKPYLKRVCLKLFILFDHFQKAGHWLQNWSPFLLDFVKVSTKYWLNCWKRRQEQYLFDFYLLGADRGSGRGRGEGRGAGDECPLLWRQTFYSCAINSQHLLLFTSGSCSVNSKPNRAQRGELSLSLLSLDLHQMEK